MKTLADIHRELERLCEKAGTQKAWAKRAGISQPYINHIMLKKLEPGPKILEAMGYEKVVSYRKIAR